MNVTCSACSTRYTIPDDKVAGRRARMQCKKCGSAIAVDGTMLASAPSAPAAQEAKAVSWNVAQPSGRRDVFTTAELIERYQREEVEPGSLVWREGMDNWLPPYDVSELAEAFAARGVRLPGAGLESSFDDDNETTRVGSSPAAVKALDAAVMRAESERSLWQEHRHEEPVTFDDETQSIGSEEALALKRKAMRTMEDIGDLGAKSDGLIDEVTRAIDSIPRVLPPLPRPPPKRPSSSPPDEATRIYEAPGAAVVTPSDDTDADEATRVFEPRSSESDDEATRVFDAPGRRESDEDESTRLYTGAPHPAKLALAHQGTVPAPLAPPAPRPPPSRPQPPPAPALPRPLPSGPAPKPPPAGRAAEHQPPRSFAQAPAPQAPVPQASVVHAPPESGPRAALPLGAAPHEEISGIGEPTRLSQRAGMTERRAAFAPTRRGNAPFVGAFVLLSALCIVYIVKPELLGLGNAPPPAEVEASGPPFDPNAAGLALEDAATTANRCKIDGGPTGPGRVHVKYVPTGRAASASVSDPYAGTDVGECLVNVFENTKVPPFGGKPVIVGKNFVIQ